MKVPFSPPDMSKLEEEEVLDAIRSGWITTGPKVKKLEREVADFCETNRAVCLNSQTSCAEMTLRLLGIGPGDEVIVPAYTYTATASVVCHVGAKLVMVDIQKDKPEMDYDILEKAINENTKVIIPVDVAGIPCDYDRIFDIVDRKKSLFKANNELQEAFDRIIVLADTAHAFGARYNDKMIGSVADFSCFSFHAVKNFTTAEGGAVTWRNIPGFDNDDIYKQYQLFSLHGQSKDALAKTKLGSWEYDILGPWYKCNMPDILGAVGLAQMERYEGLLKRRREIIGKYDEGIKNTKAHGLVHFSDNYQSSGHLYITRIEGFDEEERNNLIVKMAENEVATNVHYKPLPMMTAYKNLGFDIKEYPNAFNYFINEVTLPLYSKLTDDQVDFVIDNFVKILK